MMTYRLCVCIDEQNARSAYAFYNQQDFCVYRRVIDSVETDTEREYVRVCEVALEYFKKNIRNRYYTEHFSELLDEDRGVVLCTYRELADAFDAYRNNAAPVPEKYLPLKERFDIWSVSFVYTEGGALIDATRALLN